MERVEDGGVTQHRRTPNLARSGSTEHRYRPRDLLASSNPTQLGTAQDTCSNWSSVSGGFYSLANTADTAGFWAAFFFVPCNFPASVLCLQE
jgi:hypothetical protein